MRHCLDRQVPSSSQTKSDKCLLERKRTMLPELAPCWSTSCFHASREGRIGSNYAMHAASEWTLMLLGIMPNESLGYFQTLTSRMAAMRWFSITSVLALIIRVQWMGSLATICSPAWLIFHRRRDGSDTIFIGDDLSKQKETLINKRIKLLSWTRVSTSYAEPTLGAVIYFLVPCICSAGRVSIPNEACLIIAIS